MRRMTLSWRTVAGVLLLAALLVLALGRDLQRQERAQTLQGLVGTAALITELALEPHLAPGADADLSPSEHAAIDRAVRHLTADGRLVGLQVWNGEELVYGDAEEAEELSADERAALRLVVGGRPQVAFEHDGNRDQPTATVLMEVEDAADARTGIVAEVLLPQDETVLRLHSSAQRLYGSTGLLIAAVAVVLVVLRRRMLRREHEATHDPLTGLGNRAQLHASGEAALRAARQHPERGQVALLLLDLDGFKTVNDTLGHTVGDRLLVQVGEALAQGVRSRDVVTRLGGDEFAVLLADLPTPEVAVRVAESLCRVLQRPFTVSGVSLEVGGSVGVAVAGAGEDLDLLLRRADVAMYQAKRSGGGARLYDAADDPHDEAQLGLLAQLRGAIETDQLRLHYQPRVDLREQRAVGLEALVRWQHPERGLLYPDAFIPLAERTALMRPLTAWVLREAAQQVAEWRRTGWEVSVAVNIPPRTLLEADLCTQVLQVLAENDLPGAALELEITETAVMVDPVGAAHTIRQLRALGVGVAIDDFGAGYTSLSYLKSLPVRSLKIDRGFVTDLVSNPEDEAVARSVVALGHDLGLTVVAEGVETPDVEQRLKELGCDEVQGYLLSRPMDPTLVHEWLSAAASAGAVPTRPGTPVLAPPGPAGDR